ncbi:MAG TPA: efflux RND transporter periplasmic adaptor subunit [Candidatus Acidoferrales bacterium]|nr:efflux RND transporter periplasmic adaptor subunit [Candidatus Acidoferrales bacterium]
MKTWQKAVIGVGVIVAIAVITLVSVYEANKDVVTVQTGTVVREDLRTLVTGSGEIRPNNYTNVVGQGVGIITSIDVHEGDYVKKGDVLLHVDNVQPAADVKAQQATIDSGRAAVLAAQANFAAANATVVQRQADLEKAKLDWGRQQALFENQLISKADYDASKAAYDAAVGALEVAKAQVNQMAAAREQSQSNLAQSQAALVRTTDILHKTTYFAPISGLVSYIAVRVGENVVPGIQNSQGSFLLTLSDMSVVTAEVKVDETDITNVRNGEPAEVTIDAIQNKTFTGKVTAVGDEAILRSTGDASMTQTTTNTQEARDFKVVVTLDHPPAGLRPGLSVTAKIETAKKPDALSIPIQALAMRSQKDLATNHDSGSSVTLAASSSDVANPSNKADVQGVFIIRGNKVQFVPVQTGISGVTDIEVIKGLNLGDQIVIGSYKALRSLHSGAAIKIDNSITNSTAATSS